MLNEQTSSLNNYQILDVRFWIDRWNKRSEQAAQTSSNEDIKKFNYQVDHMFIFNK